MYKVGIYLRVRKACFVEGMSVREAAVKGGVKTYQRGGAKLYH